MAVQSTYLDEPIVAFEGMIDDIEPNTLISRNVETAALGFGKGVQQGVADYGVTAIDDAADVYRGVSVRDRSVDPASVDLTAVGKEALIMTKGVIWVTAGATVVAGAAAYVIPASGKFTSSAGGNVAVPNGIFETSGADTELVAIRLN